MKELLAESTETTSPITCVEWGLLELDFCAVPAKTEAHEHTSSAASRTINVLFIR